MKLSLTSKQILEKEFSGSPRGYSPFEVDEYLDKILKDYQLIESNVLITKKEFESQETKIKELKSKIKELEIANAKYASKLGGIKDSDKVTSNNLDLVKRIRAYEKFLYNHGFDPNNIR